MVIASRSFRAFLIPKSKTTVKTAQLVRLAPMARPAFARLKYKTISGFVGFSELTENFPHLLAKTPVARGQTFIISRNCPIFRSVFCPIWCLSVLSVLFGISQQDSQLIALALYVMRKIFDDTSDGYARDTFNTLFANTQVFRFNRYSVEFPSFVGTVLDLWEIFGNYFGVTEDECGFGDSAL